MALKVSRVLIDAIAQEDFSRIAELLAAGHSTQNAFQWAFSSEMTRFLIEHGARVQPGDESLHDAAGSGDTERLALLLGAGGTELLDQCSPDLGDTPLGAAAREARTEAVQLLLAHGSDPNHSDPERGSSSPLALAALSGNVDCVRLLLQAGADPDHSYELFSDGRQEIEEQGGEMLQLLLADDRSPAHRRRTPHAVARVLMRIVGHSDVPFPAPLPDNAGWLFDGVLAWNRDWGIMEDGHVVWLGDYTLAWQRLSSELQERWRPRRRYKFDSGWRTA